MKTENIEILRKMRDLIIKILEDRTETLDSIERVHLLETKKHLEISIGAENLTDDYDKRIQRYLSDILSL